MPETIRKVWGHEEVLVNNKEYCAKMLFIVPGKQCSLHYHENKKETFIVMSGIVILERGKKVEKLHYRQSRTILPNTPHRFAAEHGAVLLEVSTHHEDSDVVRLERSGNFYPERLEKNENRA